MGQQKNSQRKRSDSGESPSNTHKKMVEKIACQVHQGEITYEEGLWRAAACEESTAFINQLNKLAGKCKYSHTDATELINSGQLRKIAMQKMQEAEDDESSPETMDTSTPDVSLSLEQQMRAMTNEIHELQETLKYLISASEETLQVSPAWVNAGLCLAIGIGVGLSITVLVGNFLWGGIIMLTGFVLALVAYTHDSQYYNTQVAQLEKRRAQARAQLEKTQAYEVELLLKYQELKKHNEQQSASIGSDDVASVPISSPSPVAEDPVVPN